MRRQGIVSGGYENTRKGRQVDICRAGRYRVTIMVVVVLVTWEVESLKVPLYDSDKDTFQRDIIKFSKTKQIEMT